MFVIGLFKWPEMAERKCSWGFSCVARLTLRLGAKIQLYSPFVRLLTPLNINRLPQANRTGGEGVAGSNPATPTNFPQINENPMRLNSASSRLVWSLNFQRGREAGR